MTEIPDHLLKRAREARIRTAPGGYRTTSMIPNDRPEPDITIPDLLHRRYTLNEALGAVTDAMRLVGQNETTTDAWHVIQEAINQTNQKIGELTPETPS